MRTVGHGEVISRARTLLPPSPPPRFLNHPLPHAASPPSAVKDLFKAQTGGGVAKRPNKQGRCLLDPGEDKR